MKTIILALLLSSTMLSTLAQKSSLQNHEGWSFGFSAGVGSLHLSTNDTIVNRVASTAPNIHVGYWLSDRLLMQVLLPGSPYRHKGQDRGFEGVVMAGQYWVGGKVWLLAGVGLTLDAPAFWTVKDPSTANFYTGLPAVAFAVGYEVYRKDRFVVDVQYRLYAGRVDMGAAGERKGLSNMISLGLNWH